MRRQQTLSDNFMFIQIRFDSRKKKKKTISKLNTLRRLHIWWEEEECENVKKEENRLEKITFYEEKSANE